MLESIKLFLRGVIRVVDGFSFNRSATSIEDHKTDWEKLGEDWKNVGKDMNAAINKLSTLYPNGNNSQPQVKQVSKLAIINRTYTGEKNGNLRKNPDRN